MVTGLLCCQSFRWLSSVPGSTVSFRETFGGDFVEAADITTLICVSMDEIEVCCLLKRKISALLHRRAGAGSSFENKKIVLLGQGTSSQTQASSCQRVGGQLFAITRRRRQTIWEQTLSCIDEAKLCYIPFAFSFSSGTVRVSKAEICLATKGTTTANPLPGRQTQAADRAFFA